MRVVTTVQLDVPPEAGAVSDPAVPDRGRIRAGAATFAALSIAGLAGLHAVTGFAVPGAAYHEGLVQFGRRVAELADPVWSSRYAARPGGNG